MAAINEIYLQKFVDLLDIIKIYDKVDDCATQRNL